MTSLRRFRFVPRDGMSYRRKKTQAAWRNGPPSVRERLIADPKLFLRARREDEEPVAVRAAEELTHNLDIIGAMARPAARQWREAADQGGFDPL